MSLKNKTKNKAKNKARKIAFAILKPFLPFIILIIAIIFAICLVIEGLFTTEADAYLLEKAEKGELSDMEYMEWLNNKSEGATIITNGKGLIPKGMFTWPIPGYTNITSHFGMRVHPITRSI